MKFSTHGALPAVVSEKSRPVPTKVLDRCMTKSEVGHLHKPDWPVQLS